MTKINNEQMLTFLALAGNIKTVFRHSWITIPERAPEYSVESSNAHAQSLMNYRRESTADHSWRLGLMAILWGNHLDNKINTEHAVKMALVHDLGEAIAGDVPVHQQSVSVKQNHQRQELLGMEKMVGLLTSQKEEHEIFQLWMEYEEQKTPEAKFVKAIDKLEAFLQHNQDSLATWEQHEMRMLFQQKWLRPFCNYDSFLSQLAEDILNSGIQKLKDAGIDIEKVRQEALAEEQTWNTTSKVTN
jgi:putative hydrolases of HD superfamily